MDPPAAPGRYMLHLWIIRPATYRCCCYVDGIGAAPGPQVPFPFDRAVPKEKRTPPWSVGRQPQGTSTHDNSIYQMLLHRAGAGKITKNLSRIEKRELVVDGTVRSGSRNASQDLVRNRQDSLARTSCFHYVFVSGLTSTEPNHETLTRYVIHTSQCHNSGQEKEI